MQSAEPQLLAEAQIDAALRKIRKAFTDKSKKGLTKTFTELVSGDYKKTAPNNAFETALESKSLTLIEFKIAIFQNVTTEKFTFAEIRDLFVLFDTNKNGRLELDEFILGIRGSLSRERQQVVNFIFYRLDKNSSGFIEEMELREFFANSLLPEIITGQMKPAQKSQEFIKKCGYLDKISLERFTDYYINKSVKVNSDAKFQSDCLGEWLLKDEDAITYLAHQLAPSGKSPLRKKGLSFMVTRNDGENEFSPSGYNVAAEKVESIVKRRDGISKPTGVNRRGSFSNDMPQEVSPIPVNIPPPSTAVLPSPITRSISESKTPSPPSAQNNKSEASPDKMRKYVVSSMSFQRNVTNTVSMLADREQQGPQEMKPKSPEPNKDLIESNVADSDDIQIQLLSLKQISTDQEVLILQQEAIIDKQQQMIAKFQSSLGWI